MDASGSASTANANANGKRQRLSNGRGVGFTLVELNSLLDLVERYLPVDLDEWELVCQEHANLFPGTERHMDSLRRKFLAICRRHPLIPGHSDWALVERAHQIKTNIKRRDLVERPVATATARLETDDGEDDHDMSDTTSTDVSARETNGTPVSRSSPPPVAPVPAFPPVPTHAPQVPTRVPQVSSRVSHEAPNVRQGTPPAPAPMNRNPGPTPGPTPVPPPPFQPPYHYPSPEYQLMEMLKMSILQAKEDERLRREEERAWREEERRRWDRWQQQWEEERRQRHEEREEERRRRQEEREAERYRWEQFRFDDQARRDEQHNRFMQAMLLMMGKQMDTTRER
ncbi:hypothetical protein Poli38472_006229 [Pythium oligandrum]|uniref:Uncharacterized protein n=1 Tax=Pythium oligandrum TaxID=41045 RepID=A0A8K1FMX8_PYTOL|nr:hypothetical protein Poli38472_006229 [Pythium oligandrum]|eukprot:TMW68761.1 hypothetical protein Poli38472_006229 [Pythium oligandrum]